MARRKRSAKTVPTRLTITICVTCPVAVPLLVLALSR